MRKTFLAYSMIAASVVGCGKSSSETGAAPTPSEAETPRVADSVAAAAPDAAAAVPEGAGSLTDMLGSKLGLSPNQAKAGVGAILAYAEGALPSADFQKVSAAIPGAGDNIQAAKDAGATGDLVGR